MKSLNATTLTTIPALRAIANDVVFDVLMYMTPAFCESVLRDVTQQIQQFYATFRKIHPEFHGTVTLMGHSLGSVICWDLLTLLQQKQEPQQHITTDPTLKISTGQKGYEVYAQKEHADTAQNGSWGPPIANDSDFPTLPFTPEHTIFLGSPLGIFLTLRGAHPVFESLRNSTASPVSSFSLPTQSVFNIFHPSDPVAYRIEPLVSTLCKGGQHTLVAHVYCGAYHFLLLTYFYVSYCPKTWIRKTCHRQHT
jgi:phospholipase DDHD1